MKKLTKLNLKRCQIRDPIEPYAFQGLDLLRNLDLSENNININHFSQGRAPSVDGVLSHGALCAFSCVYGWVQA